MEGITDWMVKSLFHIRSGKIVYFRSSSECVQVQRSREFARDRFATVETRINVFTVRSKRFQEFTGNEELMRIATCRLAYKCYLHFFPLCALCIPVQLHSSFTSDPSLIALTSLSITTTTVQPYAKSLLTRVHLRLHPVIVYYRQFHTYATISTKHSNDKRTEAKFQRGRHRLC